MKNIILVENNIINQAVNAILKEYNITLINISKILDKNILSYSQVKTKIYSIFDAIRPIVIVNGLLFSKNEIRRENFELFYFLNQAIEDYSKYRKIPIIIVSSVDFLQDEKNEIIYEDNLSYKKECENEKKIEELCLQNERNFLLRLPLIYSTFSSYGVISNLIDQLKSDKKEVNIPRLTTNIINTFDVSMIINKLIKLCIRKYFNFEDIEIKFGSYNICSINYFTVEDLFYEILFCFEKFYEAKCYKTFKVEEVERFAILSGEKFEKNFQDIFLPRVKMNIFQQEITKIFKFQEHIEKRNF